MRNETCLMQSWRSCIALRSNMYVTFLTQMLATLVLTDAWTGFPQLLPRPTEFTLVTVHAVLPDARHSRTATRRCRCLRPMCSSMLATAAALRNIPGQGQFQPPRFDVGSVERGCGGAILRRWTWPVRDKVWVWVRVGSWGGLPIYLEHSENCTWDNSIEQLSVCIFNVFLL